MIFLPPKTVKEYAANRDELLAMIIRKLQTDDRFVAAWLSGSFGHKDADAISDLDLTVVVDNPFVKSLCERTHQIGAGTTDERLALFSQFGEPHIIHENHHNAPQDGTFTFVLYKDTALVVDWILRPDVDVQRSYQSILLFDHKNIPVEPPIAVESLQQRIEMATEQVAFFWMMVTVTVKYLIRQDDLFFHKFLDMLAGILWDVRRLVAGEPDQWIKGSLVEVAATPDLQLGAVRQICADMLALMHAVEKMGGIVPTNPMRTIDILLNFADKNASTQKSESKNCP